jgi:hypothetical protein
MVRSGFDAVGELQAALNLLIANWRLALPTGIASLTVAVIVALVVAATTGAALGAGAIGGAGAAMGGGLATMMAGSAIGFIASLVLIGLAQGAVIAGASDLWNGRPLDLQAALRTALAHFGRLGVAFAIIAGLMLVCMLLSVIGIGFVLMLAVALFAMYVLPAILVGGRAPVDAYKESYALVRANLRDSAIGAAGIVAALVVAQIVNAIAAHIPVVNFVAAFAVGGIANAYAALVQVRFYELVRGPGRI